jgi:hypothetical protein
MLTSGYYSDLNLWYLFVTAVLYKFAATEKPVPRVLPVRQAAVAFSQRSPEVLII